MGAIENDGLKGLATWRPGRKNRKGTTPTEGGKRKQPARREGLTGRNERQSQTAEQRQCEIK